MAWPGESRCANPNDRPIVSSAKAHLLGVIAVFFKTPLEVCLSRNADRPADEVVPERNVRNVYAAIEPPTIAEGFEQIIEVTVVD